MQRWRKCLTPAMLGALGLIWMISATGCSMPADRDWGKCAGIGAGTGMLGGLFQAARSKLIVGLAGLVLVGADE